MNGENSVKHHYLKKNIYYYSQLNIEAITDADYMHAKKVCNLK